MRPLTNLLVLLLLAAAGYYGYTNFIVGDDSSVEESPARSGFDCRGALAQLAQEYQCRDDASCTLSVEAEAEIKRLETDIERFCN